jgi:hypothetical protein
MQAPSESMEFSSVHMLPFSRSKQIEIIASDIDQIRMTNKHNISNYSVNFNSLELQ